MENYDHYLPQLEALVKSGSTDNIDLAIEIANSMGLYDKLLAPWRELWSYLKLDDTERNLLCECFRMEVLCISSPKLKNFPKAILSMTNLTELQIFNTKLCELPVGIAELTNLKKLYLNNNYIRKLPEEILKIQSLEFIDLSDNQLTNLPALPANIREINISSNEFNSTPDALINDHNLQVLVMCNNPGFEWDLTKLDFTRIAYLYVENTAVILEGLFENSDIMYEKDDDDKIIRVFGNTFNTISRSDYENSWNLFDLDYDDYDCEFFDYLWCGPEDYDLNDYLEDMSHKNKNRFRIRNLNFYLKGDFCYCLNW